MGNVLKCDHMKWICTRVNGLGKSGGRKMPEFCGCLLWMAPNWTLHQKNGLSSQMPGLFVLEFHTSFSQANHMLLRFIFLLGQAREDGQMTLCNHKCHNAVLSPIGRPLWRPHNSITNKKQMAITYNDYKSSFKISSEVSHIELLIQTYQLV